MSDPSMLTRVVSDERAWSAGMIDDPAAWTYRLSGTCLDAIGRFLEEPQGEPQPSGQERNGKAALDACRPCLQPVFDALNTGRGFAILDRLPVERYPEQGVRAGYRAIGQMLGELFEQDIQGTLLYDVRDTGRTVADGARFSVTNAESSFHTDNAFGAQVPDFVGLLCLRTARSGGQTQLISAVTLHNELLQQHRALLPILYRPYHFDRRGQFREGESPTTQAPIFGWNGEELTTRYLRYYIDVGHEQVHEPLNAEQEAALAAVEAQLGRPELRVEFHLRAGQILFTNNRWILHNRTAFEDEPEPERRRHYVRLWLRRGS